MPRIGNGNYQLPTGNPVTSGTTIAANWANTTLPDVAAEISNSLPRDGQAPMGAPLKIVDGLISFPGIAFNSESGTGMYRKANATIGLSCNGADALVLTATNAAFPGTVAITGTTSVGGALTTTGNTSVGGTLNVTGTSTLSSVVCTTLSGTTSTFNTVKHADGTASAPALTFSSETNTGLFRPAANQIGLAIGGTLLGLITTTGINGIDIGATTPKTGIFTTATATNASVTSATITTLTNTTLNATTVNVAGALNESVAAPVASATTPNIWSGAGTTVHITGTTTITGFTAAPQAGAKRKLIFDSAVFLTSSANLIIPGGNYTTAAGDIVDIVADTTTVFRAQVTPAVGSLPAGAIAHFAMISAPQGWLKANGAAVSRTTYASLYSAIGTLFGAGDGSTTFNLPDLRGEFIRSVDDGRGVDTSRTLGSAQTQAFASHNHGVTDPGHTHSTSDPTHSHGISDPESPRLSWRPVGVSQAGMA